MLGNFGKVVNTIKRLLVNDVDAPSCRCDVLYRFYLVEKINKIINTSQTVQNLFRELVRTPALRVFRTETRLNLLNAAQKSIDALRKQA